MSIKSIYFYSAMPYDIEHFNQANAKLPADKQLKFTYCPDVLEISNAADANGYDAVCLFVNDKATKEILEVWSKGGIKMLALRCAGFNQVDLEAAKAHNMHIARVPAYSPYGVAEHAMTLALTLNRKTHKAYNRVREGNFALDGLKGFNLFGKTVGVVGTGKIGRCFANICKGFGMKVLGYDIFQCKEFNEECGGTYVDLDTLYKESDLVSLHLPLNESTKYMVNAESLAKMKDGVLIVNTGRGGLLNTEDAITFLKNGKIGGLGLDVYENEQKLFFKDLSKEIIQDDLFRNLISFPNVLVTAHQAFFTAEALSNIADTTLNNILQISNGEKCENEVN